MLLLTFTVWRFSYSDMCGDSFDTDNHKVAALVSTSSGTMVECAIHQWFVLLQILHT